MSERKGDLNTLALYAYYLGRPPLDWAEKQVDVLIRVHQEVIAARAEDPGTFPGYCIELTTGALARRIIGELLDAGWTPPDAAELLRDHKPAELSKSQRRGADARPAPSSAISPTAAWQPSGRRGRNSAITSATLT